MTLKTMLATFQEEIGDLSALNVTTFVGPDSPNFLGENGKLNWKALPQDPEVSLVVASRMSIDLDVVNILDEGAGERLMPGLIELHTTLLETNMQIRQHLLGMLRDLML